ncbi:MAG: alpha/beta fold hydrolase [Acidimicrobiales bacterium]
MATEPTLHVDVHDGVGEHLLLVHGFLSSRAHWLPNLPRLAEVCRPVTIELWGHGRSPSPIEPEWYDPAAYPAAFETVREAVGCDRWFVCGQSLGAAFTMRYVLDCPDRVLGHIFTNSAAAVAVEAKLDPGRMEAMAEAFEQGGTESIRAQRMFPGNVPGLPDDVRAALYEDAGLHDPVGIARMLRYGSSTSSRSRIGENVVPTLLVVGEQEQGFVSPRRYLEETMPHLQVVPADAGHGVNLEAPATFDEAVVRFITELTPAEKNLVS